MNEKLKIVNRSAILIKPKNPFLLWANQFIDLEKQCSLNQIRQDCIILLIPEVEGRGDTKKYMETNFTYVFKEFIEEYTENEEEWPVIDDVELFNSWFDTEEHSLVLDSLEYELIRKE